jgi:hypothetical protein
MTGILVSGPAVGPSGEAIHRIRIITIHWLYTQDLKLHTMVLSLTGRLMMVKKGPRISTFEKGQRILLMMKFPSSHSRLQTWAVRSMSKQFLSYAAAEQLLAFDQVSAEYLCSN